MGLVYETMEAFLTACGVQYAEQSVKRFRSDLNLAGRFEDAEGCSLPNFSDEMLKRLLISYHCFSIQSFRDKKFLLLRYLRWLERRGVAVSEIAGRLEAMDYGWISSDNEFGKYYFGSFSQLVLFLQAHIDRAAEETGKDQAEFLTPAVLCSLAWHGLTAAEACSLQKTDLIETEDGAAVRLPSKTVCLEPEAAAWAGELRSARGFERFKGGAWELVSYKDGSALLRTTKAGSMTPKSISSMLTRFNACIPDSDKLFLYKRIYSSGVFYRAYLREKDAGKVLPARRKGSAFRPRERELYGTLFEGVYGPENRGGLLREIRLYQEFKQYFYSKTD